MLAISHLHIARLLGAQALQSLDALLIFLGLPQLLSCGLQALVITGDTTILIESEQPRADEEM